jgi:GntR family transcriptional regulator, rspAB operon transcriptional repressor
MRRRQAADDRSSQRPVEAVEPPASQVTSLADKAYLAIRDTILRGQLRPGTPLSRRRLARELGMSVVPVTHALRRLEEAGLVESRARTGTRVRVPSETDVRELYEVREALETQSARLFAVRASPAERLQLQRLADQMDTLFALLPANGADPAFRFAVHSQHVQFHMRIAEIAGSHLLQRMIDRNHVLILNWLFDVAGRRTRLPAGFHGRLAAALSSGDVAKADAAMRAHVRYGLSEISGQISTIGAPEWRERRPNRRAPTPRGQKSSGRR